MSALNTTLKLSAVALTLDIKYYYHNLYYNLEGERKYSKISAKMKYLFTIHKSSVVSSILLSWFSEILIMQFLKSDIYCD